MRCLVIVGFPGETEDDFAKMMKLITDVGFDTSFSFIFSPRPGTPAATLMNVYDSDKMSDVLQAAQGYEPTQDVDEADLILFNTCSVREKAQEKVFSDLGRVKHLKKKGVLIGVGGCVASQEGAAIIARAPFVDVVFGPQTLHRLPDLLNERERAQKPQVDISFPESTGS